MKIPHFNWRQLDTQMTKNVRLEGLVGITYRTRVDGVFEKKLENA